MENWRKARGILTEQLEYARFTVNNMFRYMKYDSKYQEKIDQLFHIVRKDIKINGKNITNI